MEPKNPQFIPSWPTNEPQEKKKWVTFERDYFNIELEFAKKIADTTGQSLKEVLFTYTDFYKKFGLFDGQKPDPNNVIWKEFIGKIDSGEDIIETSYGLYLNSPFKKKFETNDPTSKTFGAFKYENKGDNIEVHFISEDKDDISKISERKKEIKDMLQSIKVQFPEAKKISMLSWLLGSPIISKYLPEEFISKAKIDNDKFSDSSRWGQFVDHTGKVKSKIKEQFLNNIRNLDMNKLDSVFPVQTLKIEQDIKDFYKIYGISDEKK